LLVVSNRAAFGWTKELHARTFQSAVGNLSFADGHVEHVRASRLSSTFQRQGLATNRLVIP
jgi:prepilin-type processing-associated H-X9-DG protein